MKKDYDFKLNDVVKDLQFSSNGARKSFIEDLKKNYSDKNIVIVTHNSISRAFWLLNSVEPKSIEEINFYYQSSEKMQIYEDYIEREGLY